MYGLFVLIESQGLDVVEEMAFGQPQEISLVNTKARRDALYRSVHLQITKTCKQNIFYKRI